ncbi:glycosyltransferase family 1 protein [Reyranella sp.]|uniref:glycosyltransferase family 4 protein n=1 Tax=Reyranella sp. TaxID=1929291 RepID=UPI001222482E|nr:glycosyltransferase family 1 protein [Reyranella sp.]TAJ90996.1 MAG: glycosyltransferase family 1 protein [Reyranella sp.]
MRRALFDVSGLVQWYAYLSNPSGIQRVMESILSQPALLRNPAVTLVSRAIGSDTFYIVEPDIIAGLVTRATRRASIARLRGLFAESMRLAEPMRLLHEMHSIHVPYIALGFSFTERFWESRCAGRWTARASKLRTIAPDDAYDALVGLGDFWCHGGHVPALITLKRRSGAKLIHLVHDLIAAVNPQWTHPHYGKQFLDQFGSLAPAVDHWLVTSTYVGGQLAGYLDQQGLSGRPIDTMPMGWPEPLPIQDDDSVLAKHGLERQRFLMHVGTVEPRKNLDGLFDALGRLRSEEAVSALPCVLVGRDGWRSETIRQRLKDDPWLASRVKWIKDAPDGDLAALYRSARFTVVPSFDEGWGLAVQESLAHRTPCIAARVGGIPEAGLDLVDYVESGDTDALAAAIRTLANDGDALERARARIIGGLAATPLPAWSDTADRLAGLLGVDP